MASGGVFYDNYHSYNSLEAALYAGLHRPAWALGSAILLLTASYGRIGKKTIFKIKVKLNCFFFNEGVMKTFLNWKPWIPLSKLVYSAYLIHMCWQLRSTAMVMSPRYATFFDIFQLALGDIVLSFLLALVMYLVIETPFRKVFRVILTRNKDGKEIKDVPLERTVINVSNSTEDSQM